MTRDPVAIPSPAHDPDVTWIPHTTNDSVHNSPDAPFDTCAKEEAMQAVRFVGVGRPAQIEELQSRRPVRDRC